MHDVGQANAIVSFNNKPAADAVPFFDQVTAFFYLLGICVYCWNLTASKFHRCFLVSPLSFASLKVRL